MVGVCEPPSQKAFSGPGAGNPVFEFRAGFRRGAASLQRILVSAGLMACLLPAVLWLAAAVVDLRPWFAERFALNLYWRLAYVNRALFWSGLVLLPLGCLWGFGWRLWLRSAFRRRYGLPRAGAPPARTGDESHE
jgi:hypothetical protein